MMTAMCEECDRNQKKHTDQAAFPVAILAHRVAFEAFEPIFKSSTLGAAGFFRHRQNLLK
jgi:hypothetical protein